MEGPAQLLKIANVMWGGLESSVKLVRKWLILVMYYLPARQSAQHTTLASIGV